MATIIDILSVELGLNSAKFTAGVKEAGKAEEKLDKTVEKTGKTIEKTSKKANTHARDLDDMARKGVKALNDVRNAAIQMFAAYATASGLKSLIENLTVSNANLGLMSKNLGISVVELKQWGNVAEQLGGSAAGAQQDIANLARELKDVPQTGGMSQTLMGIQAMGVSIQAANGKFKTSTQLMLDIAERVKDMKREDAYAYISNHTGMDESTINMMLQGRDALQKQLDAQKANAEAAAANAEKSQQLRAQVAKTKQKFEDVANTLLIKVSPLLIKLAEWLERNGDMIVKVAVTLGVLGAAFGALQSAWFVMALFKNMITAAGVLIKILPLLGRGLGLLRFALAGLLSPAGFVIAIIALLAAGFIYAYKHYKGFADLVDHALDWLGFGKKVDGATGSFEKMKNGLSDLAKSVKDEVKPVLEWLAQVMDKIWQGDLKGAAGMVGQKVKEAAVTAAKAVINSPVGKAVGGAYGDAKAGYHEGQTGEKTEGANEGSMPYRGGKAVGTYAKGTFKSGLMSLTPDQVEDIIKTASTEVVPSLKGNNMKNQAAAVVDTILNRAALAGGDVRGVINKFGAFSMINSNLRDKNGKKIAYGGVQYMPDSHVKANVRQAVLEHLQARDSGKRSIVGGDVNYANPYYLGQASEATKKWVREVWWQAKQTGQIFGSGTAIHVHGTPTGSKRAPEFGVRLLNQGSSTTGTQQVPRIPTGAALSRPAIEASARPQNISTSEVKIDKIEVVTQASNAQGIASDIGGAVRRNGLIGRVIYGMT